MTPLDIVVTLFMLCVDRVMEDLEQGHVDDAYDTLLDIQEHLSNLL